MRFGERRPKGLIALALAALLLPVPALADECVSHGWGRLLECHADISKDGALVHVDSYIEPHVGIAFRVNTFKNFDVIRVAPGGAAIENVVLSPWVPAAPDFQPVTEWTPYEWNGSYPAVVSGEANTYLKDISTPTWTVRPEWETRTAWKGNEVTFIPRTENRFVDQFYYEGLTGPRGGYFQDRYVWDMTGLGVWAAPALRAIQWPLLTTSRVRPGTYVLEISNQVTYDAVKPACETSLVKSYKPGALNRDRKGSLKSELLLTHLKGDCDKIVVTDRFPDGFDFPKRAKDLKVWLVKDGVEYHLKAGSDCDGKGKDGKNPENAYNCGLVSVDKVNGTLTVTLERPTYSVKQVQCGADEDGEPACEKVEGRVTQERVTPFDSVRIKYKLDYDKKTCIQGQSTVTTVEATTAGQTSRYDVVTNLLVKEVGHQKNLQCGEERDIDDE